VSYNPLFMKRAFALAARGDGAVQPNPYVGAVAVKEGRVVGEGYHASFGGPHAEVQALSIDSRLAEGCELYVTLEPCNHYGKTPPCTELIIQKKVKAVYAAMKDPNPLVSGQGLRRLKEAGVLVQAGFQEKKARKMNRVFIKNILDKEPYVILKYAMTADGYIASCNGDSRWISCEESRQEVHLIRHNVKGIMVGAGTIIKDNPRLTARIDPEGWQPRKIVYDPRGDLIGDLHPLNGEALILTEGEKYLDREGFRNYTLPKDPAAFRAAFYEVLWKEGVTSLLVEGGSFTIHRMFEADAVDEVVVFIAPKLLGGGLSPSGGKGFTSIEQARKLLETSWQKVGEDMMMKGFFRDVYRTH